MIRTSKPSPRLILAVIITAAMIGCVSFREAIVTAFVEDRSVWTPEMREDVNRCDEEVVGGRWGWGRMDGADPHRALPRSFSDARRSCLRAKGWKL